MKDDVGYREKPFNILDVERSTNTLINMDLGLDANINKISVNNTLEKTDSHEHSEVKLNCKDDLVLEPRKELPKINNSCNDKAFNADKSKLSDLLLHETEKHNKPSFQVEIKEKLENSSLVTNQQTLDNKLPNKNLANQIKGQTTSLVETTDSERGNQSKTIENSSTDPINNYEIKEKRERRRNNRNSSMTEKPDSIAVEKPKEIKLEDEDDLDFLLSLKKPISSEEKTETKPAGLKGDTSYYKFYHALF